MPTVEWYDVVGCAALMLIAYYCLYKVIYSEEE